MNVFELVPGQATFHSPESFRQVWNEAAAAIADVYVEGTLDWIGEHHPELAEQIRQAGDEIDAFWGQDFEGFEEAVDRWRGLYLEAVRLAAI